MTFVLSCNMEINTVDPQASTGVDMSKQYGFFITEYRSQDLGNKFVNINELWAEHVWFNKIKKGKIVREGTEEVQLNFKVDSFYNPNFVQENYMIDWIMKDAKGSSIGQSNGLFNLIFKETNAPDSIEISICKFRKDRTLDSVFQFRLAKK